MKANIVYKPFYQAKNKYCVLYGGAGSGKSHAVAQKILKRIDRFPNHRILIVRKVARTLRASVFQMFRDLIEFEGIGHKFKINKSDMTIENIMNKSTLLFYGLDDVEKLKSIAGITSIWIEEASELNQKDFDQLDLRLRSDNQNIYMQIILTFNPISSYHWLKKKFFDIGVDDCYIQKTTYLDNRFLPEKYKDVFENLRRTNPEYYEVYALGNWGIIEGVIYKDITIIDKLPEYCEDEYIGLDFGYNHPYVVVHVKIEKSNIYVNEIIYESELPNQNAIKKINDRFSFIRDLMIYADSARPDLINDFVEDGFMIEKANKSVFDGINTVKSFNIHVTNTSKNILREFELYSWKKDKNDNFMDEPIKQNDDAMDAIRYALTPFIQKKGVLKSISLDFL